jgi:hypothetical protein
MTDPQRHIEEIRKRGQNSHDEIVDSLAGAIDRLEKTFPGQWHFLMEFIQNADDAGSTKLSIDISRDEIRVLNDGNRFDDDDVESICKVGRSSKTYTEKGEDYIGYLGVGFKSVFLISDNPQIYSGNYRFEFNKDAWGEQEETPWQIYPLWIEDESRDIAKNGYTTGFRIPLSETVDDEMFDKLIEEVSAEQISDRTLLFLRNLEEIEIKDRVRGKTKKLRKKKTSQTPNYELYEFEIYEGGEVVETRNWLVFRSTSKIPPQIKGDQLTKRWERDNLNTREVMVGFRLNDNQGLTKEEGTAHMGVFSFLPLKEVPSGLNFLVQADFLTAPGREAINREAPWNEWLAEEVFKLLRDQVISTFKNDDRWKHNFTDVLYPESGGHEIFDEQIHQPLQNYLKSNPVLIDQDEDFVKAENSVEVNSKIDELVSNSELEELYPEKSILHQDCEVPLELGKLAENGPSYKSKKGFLNRMDDLLELKAQQEDIEFFTDFYKSIAEYSDSSLRPAKKEDLVLTQGKRLESPRNVSLPNTEVDIPEDVELTDHFNLVHESLLDGDVEQFFKRLGVEYVTQDMVRRVQEDLSSIAEDWNKLSEKERIEKTRFCKNLWSKDQVTPGELDFLTVKTKEDNWVEPEETVFSSEFNPNHAIEDLYDEGLISLDLAFLSDEYVTGSVEESVDEWRRFFENIGVDEGIPKKNISEQIAIETTLEFEKENGRDPEALSHDKETGGYDIKSISATGERLIEAKGRKNASPKISLTPNQFKNLKEEGDNYYIYVVRDTLKNPTLSVIKGENILNVERSISINFDEWHELGKQEYRPAD